MNKPNHKTDEILDAAQSMVQRFGYNGFSFREIADKIGIKSASVHYHFPTKADLGKALAHRYTERFIASLGNPNDPEHQADALIDQYIDAYRHSLVVDGGICLCGILGSEVQSLPAIVALEVKEFFEKNTQWLSQVYQRLDHSRSNFENEDKALQTVAMLEGAMIIARTLNDFSAYDRVADLVKELK